MIIASTKLIDRGLELGVEGYPKISSKPVAKRLKAKAKHKRGSALFSTPTYQSSYQPRYPGSCSYK
jgi:hypothetical protein